MVAVCLLVFATMVRADVAVPALKARVTDLTGTLSAQQTHQLEAQLVALEQRKGAQIVVLMLPSTQPEDIADYATRVFDQWKIGRKDVDDGVLVVVAKDDHRAMIETGYGLEGAIPDAAASRIIREYMSPKFRVNDFQGGLNDAIGALTKLIDGEPLPPPLPPTRPTNSPTMPSPSPSGHKPLNSHASTPVAPPTSPARGIRGMRAKIPRAHTITIHATARPVNQSCPCTTPPPFRCGPCSGGGSGSPSINFVNAPIASFKPPWKSFTRNFGDMYSRMMREAAASGIAPSRP
jgi:hypothetical protein